MSYDLDRYLVIPKIWTYISEKKHFVLKCKYFNNQLRVILLWRQVKDFNAKTPVILVPGVNHSQIASGPMPSNVVNNDIPATVSYEEAHGNLSEFANAFMAANGRGCNSSVTAQAEKTLRNQQNSTGEIVQVKICRVWSQYRLNWSFLNSMSTDKFRWAPKPLHGIKSLHRLPNSFHFHRLPSSFHLGNKKTPKKVAPNVELIS